MNTTYNVGAYYFPNYHVDPRNEAAHGKDWTEWELVKRAEPKFPGHGMPVKPLWGYEDESDPKVMAKKISAAADHGLDHFIFDWYWYEDGAFLRRGLETGFLGAANVERMKFALMWANHDWIDIHPAKAHGSHKLLYPGAVTTKAFDVITDYIIDHYFRHPCYFKLEGRPYFSIYELMTLARGLGGIAKTKEALSRFREKVKAAGLPGLHLNAVIWGVQILPNEQKVTNPAQMLTELGFDSVSSYVWIHHVPLPDFPQTDYEYVSQEAQKHWEAASKSMPVPFFPNVTMGWDSSPRTVQSDKYENRGYPFMASLKNNTPARFEKALQAAKAFLAPKAASQRVISINAWNEWTEGSYLEPDTKNKMAYLEAIRRVFGKK